ncbi:MAG: hypothetical protein IJT97_08295 [Bacteroidaceae bacterium]|nr:hypothetical protein [Bacteroidaceae bacterium]
MEEKQFNETENVQPQDTGQVTNQQTENQTEQGFCGIPLPPLPSLPSNDENRQSEYSVKEQCKSEFVEMYNKERASSNQPPGYLYGMTNLQRAYNRNSEKQFEMVMLVGSLADALAISEYGYQPVWIDGSMNFLSQEDFCRLKKFAKKIICIPNIGHVSMRQAKSLALRLTELNMVWMTDDDMECESDTPRTHTTLADFIALHPQVEDVERLMGRAISAQFCWINDKGNIFTSLERLNHFLWLNGYGTIEGSSSDKPAFVHIKDNIVEHVQSDDIKAFVEKQMTKSGMTEEMRNRVHLSRILPTSRHSDLWRFEGLDFTNHTSDSRLFFFRNCWAEVFKNHIETHPYSELDNHYVWKERVVDHDFTLLPSMFNIILKDDSCKVTFPEGMTSKLMQIAWNTCRIYWRKKDEQELELTDSEKTLEQQCFASRVAALGYLIDPQKVSFAAYLVVFVDYKLGTNKDEKNGRTGKSRLAEAAGQIVGLFKRKGDKTSMNSRFVFGGITDEKGLLYIDEYDTSQGIDSLLSNVTGDFVLEKKGETISSIPFERAPKIAIATNSVFTQTGSSYSDRIWYQPIGDYYHKMDDSNDYQEDRSIYDDIGFDHMGLDYPDEEWNRDLNFLLQCQQFSMSLPPNKKKIVVGMEQLNHRALQATTDQDFSDWAEDFLSPDAGNLNRMMAYADVYQSFLNDTGKEMVRNDFTRQLKNYCRMAGLVYNPANQFPNQKGPKGNERKDGDPAKSRIEGKLTATVYIQSAVPTQSADEMPSCSTKGDLPF